LEWRPPFARWFIRGLLNACYNCVDRHLETWRRNKAAYIWEGEPGDRRILTYLDLYREVNLLAGVLRRRFDIQKGDFVGMYMPMVPELPISMLACARIGAPFTQVFSGFSVGSLAERLRDVEARLLITADGVWRRGRVIDLKGVADEAVEECPSIEKVIVVRRIGHDVSMVEGRDHWYHGLIEEEPLKHIPPEPVDSDHPLFVLHTSGTTAKPKGVQHSTGGYLTWVCTTLEWCFDVGEEDTWWCAADIGWITGHSYIVFGPLALGLTSILYEGAPDHPDPGRLWSMVERYHVTHFYTSPTLIRLLMRHGEEWPRRYDLSSLKVLGTVGEPINPEAWRWYYEVIGKRRTPIIDTWWQTETGGFMVAPTRGIELVPLKPGSATFPLPGVMVDVVDEEGNPLPRGVKGHLVVRKPWPGMLLTLFKEDERYRQHYWERYPKAEMVFYTGDYAMMDEEGYIWFLGRVDDVIKVAAHRIGTIEMEDALVAHKAVAEAAVIGKPDPVKGEVPVCFVTLRMGFKASPQLAEELKAHIRRSIGALATPAKICFVSKVPKTRSGKIMRRLLKDIVAGLSLGDTTALEDPEAVEECRRAFEE
jgi:acetyl-CoA synthetase